MKYEINNNQEFKIINYFTSDHIFFRPYFLSKSDIFSLSLDFEIVAFVKFII